MDRSPQSVSLQHSACDDCPPRGSIAQLLGEKAESLLKFNKPKISKERLHVPGPDVVDRIFAGSDRNNRVLCNLQRIININKFSNITTLLNALPSTGEQSYGYGYYEEPGTRPWLKKIFNT